MLLSNASGWLMLAFLLAGLEMFTGSLYLLALAIAMLGGSAAAWFDVAVPAQLSIIAISSLLLCSILSVWRSGKKSSSQDTFMDVGQKVRVDARTQDVFRVTHRGTQWDAELADGAEAGMQEYFIQAVHGSTLILHNKKETN